MLLLPSPLFQRPLLMLLYFNQTSETTASVAGRLGCLNSRHGAVVDVVVCPADLMW